LRCVNRLISGVLALIFVCEVPSYGGTIGRRTDSLQPRSNINDEEFRRVFKLQGDLERAKKITRFIETGTISTVEDVIAAAKNMPGVNASKDIVVGKRYVLIRVSDGIAIRYFDPQYYVTAPEHLVPLPPFLAGKPVKKSVARQLLAGADDRRRLESAGVLPRLEGIAPVLRPVGLAASLGKSDLTDEQIRLLQKRSRGVMTIYEFLEKHRDAARGGYSLGLSDYMRLYQSVSLACGLVDSETVYGRMFQRRDARTLEFMPQITSEGKPVVFFVPNDVFSHHEAGVTRDELQWLLDNPDRLKDVYFVFGLYDTVRRKDYRQLLGSPRRMLRAENALAQAFGDHKRYLAAPRETTATARQETQAEPVALRETSGAAPRAWRGGRWPWLARWLGDDYAMLQEPIEQMFWGAVILSGALLGIPYPLIFAFGAVPYILLHYVGIPQGMPAPLFTDIFMMTVLNGIVIATFALSPSLGLPVFLNATYLHHLYNRSLCDSRDLKMHARYDSASQMPVTDHLPAPGKAMGALSMSIAVAAVIGTAVALYSVGVFVGLQKSVMKLLHIAVAPRRDVFMLIWHFTGLNCIAWFTALASTGSLIGSAFGGIAPRRIMPVATAVSLAVMGVPAVSAFVAGGIIYLLCNSDQLVLLLHALSDPAKLAVVAAWMSVARLGLFGSDRSEQVLYLVSALYSSDKDTVRVAAGILGKSGNQEGIRALVDRMQTPDHELRQACVDGLRAAGAAGVPALLPLVRGTDTGIRCAALNLLGNAGDKNVVDSIAASLDDENWYVRVNAAQALERLGDGRGASVIAQRDSIERPLRDRYRRFISRAWEKLAVKYALFRHLAKGAETDIGRLQTLDQMRKYAADTASFIEECAGEDGEDRDAAMMQAAAEFRNIASSIHLPEPERVLAAQGAAQPLFVRAMGLVFGDVEMLLLPERFASLSAGAYARDIVGSMADTVPAFVKNTAYQLAGLVWKPVLFLQNIWSALGQEADVIRGRAQSVITAEVERITPAPQIPEKLVISRIGKRIEVDTAAFVLDGDAGAVALKDPETGAPIRELALRRVAIDASKAADIVSSLPVPDAGHAALIQTVLGIMKSLPADKAPVWCGFGDLVRDLFGFAAAGGGVAPLIALYEPLMRDPVAVFHEACEYLIAAGLISARIEGERVIVLRDAAGAEIGRVSLTRDDAAKQLVKGPDAQHYMVRALTRELFCEADVKLRDFIKRKQFETVIAPMSPQDIRTLIGFVEQLDVFFAGAGARKGAAKLRWPESLLMLVRGGLITRYDLMNRGILRIVQDAYGSAESSSGFEADAFIVRAAEIVGALRERGILTEKEAADALPVVAAVRRGDGAGTARYATLCAALAELARSKAIVRSDLALTMKRAVALIGSDIQNKPKEGVHALSSLAAAGLLTTDDIAGAGIAAKLAQLVSVPDQNVRCEAAQCLAGLAQARLVEADDIVPMIQFEKITAHVNDHQLDKRGKDAQVIEILAKSGMMPGRYLNDAGLIDRLAAGLASRDDSPRLRSAGALAALVKAGSAVDIEKIRAKIPFRDLDRALNAAPMLRSQSDMAFLHVLASGGLLRGDDIDIKALLAKYEADLLPLDATSFRSLKQLAETALLLGIRPDMNEAFSKVMGMIPSLSPYPLRFAAELVEYIARERLADDGLVAGARGKHAFDAVAAELNDENGEIQICGAAAIKALSEAGLFVDRENVDIDQLRANIDSPRLTNADRLRILQAVSRGDGPADKKEVESLKRLIESAPDGDPALKGFLSLMSSFSLRESTEAQDYLESKIKKILQKEAPAGGLVPLSAREKAHVDALWQSFRPTALIDFVFRRDFDPSLRAEILRGLAAAKVVDAGYADVKDADAKETLDAISQFHAEFGIIPPKNMVRPFVTGQATFEDIRENKDAIRRLKERGDYRELIRALVKDEKLMVAYYCLEQSPFFYPGTTTISFDMFRGILQEAAGALEKEDELGVTLAMQGAFFKAGLSERDAQEMAERLFRGGPPLPNGDQHLKRGRFAPVEIDLFDVSDRSISGYGQIQQEFIVSRANIVLCLKYAHLVAGLRKDIPKVESEKKRKQMYRRFLRAEERLRTGKITIRDAVKALVSLNNIVYERQTTKIGTILNNAVDRAVTRAMAQNPVYIDLLARSTESFYAGTATVEFDDLTLAELARGMDRGVQSIERLKKLPDSQHRKGSPAVIESPEEALQLFFLDLANKGKIPGGGALDAIFRKQVNGYLDSVKRYCAAVRKPSSGVAAPVLYLDYVDKNNLFEALRFADGAHTCNTSGHDTYLGEASRWLTDATTFFFQITTEPRGGKQIGWLKCWLGVDDDGYPFIGANYLFLNPQYADEKVRDAVCKKVEEIFFKHRVSMVAQTKRSLRDANAMPPPDWYSLAEMRIVRLQSLIDGKGPIKADVKIEGNKPVMVRMHVSPNPATASRAALSVTAFRPLKKQPDITHHVLREIFRRAAREETLSVQDARSGQIRQLYVIDVRRLSDYPEGNKYLLNALKEWLQYPDVRVKYPEAVAQISAILEDADIPQRSRTLFVMTPGGTIEGIMKTAGLHMAEYVEAAPWNRGEALQGRRYKGIGPQMFYLMLKDFGVAADLDPVKTADFMKRTDVKFLEPSEQTKELFGACNYGPDGMLIPVEWVRDEEHLARWYVLSENSRIALVNFMKVQEAIMGLGRLQQTVAQHARPAPVVEKSAKAGSPISSMGRFIKTPLNGPVTEFIGWMDAVMGRSEAALNDEELKGMSHFIGIDEGDASKIRRRTRQMAQAAYAFAQSIPDDGKMNIFLLRDAFSLYYAAKALGRNAQAVYISKAFFKKLAGTNTADFIMPTVVAEVKQAMGLHERDAVPAERFADFKERFFTLFDKMLLDPSSLQNPDVRNAAPALQKAAAAAEAYLRASGITPESAARDGIRFIDTTVTGTLVLFMEGVMRSAMKRAGMAGTDIQGKTAGWMYYSKLSDAMSFTRDAETMRIVEGIDYPVSYDDAAKNTGAVPLMRETGASSKRSFLYLLNALKSELSVIPLKEAGRSVAPAVPKADYLQVREPFYSEVSKKDGSVVSFLDAEGARAFGEKLVAEKQAEKYEDIMVAGRSFTVIVENGVELTGEMAKVLIEEALKRTADAGGDIGRLPGTLVISLLDSSSHLFEDHLANGFIGVNKAIKTIKSEPVRSLLVRIGVFHEICHEITGGAGSAFETAQMERDACYGGEVVPPIAAALILPSLEAWCAAHLEGAAAPFIQSLAAQIARIEQEAAMPLKSAVARYGAGEYILRYLDHYEQQLRTYEKLYAEPKNISKKEMWRLVKVAEKEYNTAKIVSGELRRRMGTDNSSAAFIRAIRDTLAAEHKGPRKCQQDAVRIMEAEQRAHPDVGFVADEVLFADGGSWVGDLLDFELKGGRFMTMRTPDGEQPLIIVNRGIRDLSGALKVIAHELMHKKLARAHARVLSGRALHGLLSEAYVEQQADKLFDGIVKRHKEVREEIDRSMSSEDKLLKLFGMLAPAPRTRAYLDEQKVLDAVMGKKGDRRLRIAMKKFLVKGDAAGMERYFDKDTWKVVEALVFLIKEKGIDYSPRRRLGLRLLEQLFSDTRDMPVKLEAALHVMRVVQDVEGSLDETLAFVSLDQDLYSLMGDNAVKDRVVDMLQYIGYQAGISLYEDHLARGVPITQKAFDERFRSILPDGSEVDRHVRDAVVWESWITDIYVRIRNNASGIVGKMDAGRPARRSLNGDIESRRLIEAQP